MKVEKFVSKEQKDIHNKIMIGVRNGSIVKPCKCDDCTTDTDSFNLQAHHTDYNKPLDVVWLCRGCHGKRHTKENKGKVIQLNKSRPRSKEYLEEMLAEARKILPHNIFAALFQAARGRAGGKKKASNRLTALEQMAIDPGAINKASYFDLERVIEKTEGHSCDLLISIRKRHGELLDGMPTAKSIVDMVTNGQAIPSVDVIDMEVAEVNDDGSFMAGLYNSEELLMFENPDGISVEAGSIVQISDGSFTGISQSLEPNSLEESDAIHKEAQLLKKHSKQVSFTGPSDAKLLFVGAAPDKIESARREPFVGTTGESFRDNYLEPLGLQKSDVAIGFVMPVMPVDNMVTVEVLGPWKEYVAKQIANYPKAKVVAVGKMAREALKSFGVTPDFNVIHPAAVLHGSGDKTEIKRKIRQINKALDAKSENGQDATKKSKKSQRKAKSTNPADDQKSRLLKSKAKQIQISKASGEKQIVYGVVLDPYIIDAHNDWIPPAEIEQTAHGFLKRSRVVGLEHKGKASAEVVESWVEPYPTDADYKAALDNQPHSVNRRKFGDDFLHSGTWVLGVELGDAEWAKYLSGEITGFSPGGFSFKSPIDIVAMPKVKIIEV